MRLTQVIRDLQKFVDKHGDRDVVDKTTGEILKSLEIIVKGKDSHGNIVTKGWSSYDHAA